MEMQMGLMMDSYENTTGRAGDSQVTVMLMESTEGAAADTIDPRVTIHNIYAKSS